jgi:hypothetical protein
MLEVHWFVPPSLGGVTHRPAGLQSWPIGHVTPLPHICEPWQTPFTHCCPLGQPMPLLQALLVTHWPVVVQIWPVGHGAFGPHWVIVTVQIPAWQTWPAGHWVLLMHRPQAPFWQVWHVPLMQT